MTNFKELFEVTKFSISDPEQVQDWVEKNIEQNYSDDELSPKNALKLMSKIAKLIKSGKIKNKNDIENEISSAVNNN